MNDTRNRFSSLLACAVCLALLLLLTGAQANETAQDALADAPPAALIALAEQHPATSKAQLPTYRLVGKSRLTFWGIQVYDARLWATPTFKPDNLAAQFFALELAYLRDFESSDIAKRSLSEMRRSATFTDAQAKTWTLEMQRVIPDVKKGDRIMGVNHPGVGAVFLVNGKPGGEIRDVEFARLFFGIWLSSKTSEPQLRQALLAGVL